MNKKIVIVLTGAVLVGLAGFALAQETEDGTSQIEQKNEQKREEIKTRIEERNQRLEEAKEQRQDLQQEREQYKEEMRKKRCENVENRIRTRIGRYENSQQRHVKILNNMEAKLNLVILKLEEDGLDVSRLKTDVTVLSGMIDDIIAVHQAFMDELKESQNYACGESEGEFKNQLGEARRILPEVREGIQDIREYYRDTIRPEILELRNQLESV